MEKFAIVDIETTGGHSGNNKITEIAIICVDGEKITETWSSLINPERSIPWGITRLTGIDDHMVMDAPKFYQVAKKIIELTQNRIFVAHNAFFDYRFIQKEFSELGFTFQREVMCTVRMARKAFLGFKSYSLSALAKEFHIIQESHHRALDDAKACYEIFKLIKSKNGEFITKIEMKPLPPNLDEASFLNLPKTPGTYFFYNKEGVLLYVGKAKSLKDRVTQHFSKLGESKKDLELKKEIYLIKYLEWGSEIVASLMELHYIKTLSPMFNRAGRKKNFRYSLSFHPNANTGDEIRVSTLKGVSYGMWGSKKSANDARAKIYKNLFGLDIDSLFFKNQIEIFKSTLGEKFYHKKLQTELEKINGFLSDQEIKVPGRVRSEKAFIVIKNNAIKEIKFIHEFQETEIFPLEDYPDMRRLLEGYLANLATP